MKAVKIIAVVLMAALIAAAGVLIGIDYAKDDGVAPPADIVSSNLIAEEYPDYKNDVYLEKGDDPDLNELGLFWCREVSPGVIEMVPADTAEGAAIVDSSKPTVINVHGMMTDGYYRIEDYVFNNVIGSSEEFGYDGAVVPYDTLQTLWIWLDKGWNVGVYNWHRFVSEGVDFAAIEAKVWSTDGPANVRWRSSDGKYHDDPVEYSLAELFVGDYLRALELLDDDFGKEEIRFTAHSMGGELVSAAAFLLYEISEGESAQISTDKLPDRMTMDDTFFGAYLQVGDNLFDISAKGLSVRWTGKDMPDDRTGRAVIEAIQYLAKKGVAIEYYTYNSSFLNLAIPAEDRQILLDSSVYILADPNYVNPDYGEYSLLTDGHVALRKYSQCSICRAYLGGEMSDAEKVAYANALPTSELKKLVGKAFLMTGGASTLTTADDVFEEISHAEIMKKGDQE